MAAKRTGPSTSSGKKKRVAALSYPREKRKNIPTAETQSFMQEDEAKPQPLLYNRNPDLDPQLVWKGKDEQDRTPLVVDTVPIYIQEKIHPKQIVDDLKRLGADSEPQADLFADFNGIDPESKLEFYAHDQNWSNRMILGDALLVMNSLAEKEKLRGRVQMIYVDPPYGIKFASNWQASTKKRDVKDGKLEDATREPEVIKAFRDTWELGIHSYLSYLRERLIVARELLAESGSVFVQIGDQNVHLVRSLLDEVYGPNNCTATIQFKKTAGLGSELMPAVTDYVLWYAKERHALKAHRLFETKQSSNDGPYSFIEDSYGVRRRMTTSELLDPDSRPREARVYREQIALAAGLTPSCVFELMFHRKRYLPRANRSWSSNREGMDRLIRASRIGLSGRSVCYIRYLKDFPVNPLTNFWSDTSSGSAMDKVYVVQTSTNVIERCMLMCTDPGDLVLDPTCGSGTTAYVAEQWGRRWITIDTSRVALALARTRLMAARFPYYVLADSPEGLGKEAEVTGKPPAERSTNGDIQRGFVYERVPHITLKSIANNAEIDVIYEKWQRTLEPLRAELNRMLKKSWEDWEIPREPEEGWSAKAVELLDQWWEARRQRQKEIDDSIARNAETEYLYDRPYDDKGIVRVTGPFTVESLSPHRILPTDEEDEILLDALDEEARERGEEPPPRPKRRKLDTAADDFVRVILENLKVAGVQNTKKKERLMFPELKPWAGGRYIHAEGRYQEGGKDRRAAITIGPEYGTVSYQLVREAAREARDLFDVLVICGFAFEPYVGEETMSLGRLVVLKARMNQDLHMAEHLKKTGAGNLFVVFGEPDVRIEEQKDGNYRVSIRGVDVFDPTTGEVRSGSTDDIACWFIDTNYDEESFFVRHAYFLGGKDPYERLKRTLKAEIDEEAWATLYSPISRPFPKPNTGKIAVKVINHYGDEVLKVFRL